jgi:hypothetical protein
MPDRRDLGGCMEQPQAAHSRPREGLGGLRRAQAAARRLPRRPFVPQAGRASGGGLLASAPGIRSRCEARVSDTHGLGSHIRVRVVPPPAAPGFDMSSAAALPWNPTPAALRRRARPPARCARLGAARRATNGPAAAVPRGGPGLRARATGTPRRTDESTGREPRRRPLNGGGSPQGCGCDGCCATPYARPPSPGIRGRAGDGQVRGGGDPSGRGLEREQWQSGR